GNKGGGVNALVTRIHVQYTNETFPEDLMFTETSDRSNFQGRYILRHPWKGSPNECSEAREYFKNYNRMEETRAKNLANLTGWDINKIRSKINLKELKEDNTPWWKKVWK
ncbi:MAG: hypothetical protein KDK36_00890, partial [Leptospiraceae bacterium]|nr:hypothetical protein [Leptospiraceae bacterium]